MNESPLNASLLPRSVSAPRVRFGAVLVAAAPLLLAIAGSALTPLPCAFSLAGVGLGTVALTFIGVANNYTSILMVRMASKLGVSGYEEVVLAAGGRRALKWCRVALIILLFGTMCGCLAAIQETGARAIGELGEETGSVLPLWLSSSSGGSVAFLVAVTTVLLLPLSLASLGEMQCVSLLGVTLMISISAYVVGSAVAVYLPTIQLRHRGPAVSLFGLPQTSMALTEAASTFGYAFYVQPCAVPLLRTLPAGEEGASTLVAALYVTFAVTGVAYMCVGLGGLFFFGEGARALTTTTLAFCLHRATPSPSLSATAARPGPAAA